eukprot:6466043-Pyramimonas_sp.AAC.2
MRCDLFAGDGGGVFARGGARAGAAARAGRGRVDAAAVGAPVAGGLSPGGGRREAQARAGVTARSSEAGPPRCPVARASSPVDRPGVGGPLLLPPLLLPPMNCVKTLTVERVCYGAAVEEARATRGGGVRGAGGAEGGGGGGGARAGGAGQARPRRGEQK